MTPFLESVAKYIFEKHENKLYELAIVFPNKRARLFFNQYIGQLSSKPVFAPKYYTITEYMQQLTGTPIADQLTLLFTLYEVYISVTNSNESFDQFLFYCEMLLADFDDLDKYLVDAGMLYKNLSNLKEIEAYYDYLDEAQIKAIEQFWRTFAESKPSEEKQKFSSLWNVLYKIYLQFNSKLSELGLAYEGGAYRQAIASLKEGDIDIREKYVVFVGFNALNNCEIALFSYLKKRNKALFFWDYDAYYIDRKAYHEAAYFMADLIQKYPAPEEFVFESKLQNSERTIKIIDIATSTGQAKALPLILQELPNNWQQHAHHTAIALADEALLMPVLNALPKEIEEVNISMGYPLKETRAYSLTQTLLELQKNKRIATDKQELYYHTNVSQILQFGLINNQESDWLTLTKLITKQNLIYLKTSELSGLKGIFADIFCPGIGTENFVVYLIKILTQLTLHFNKENKNTYAIEKEATFRILNQLTRINDILKNTSISYNFTSLAKLLAKLLEGTSIPFSGEPLSGVQIMGVLETRNLDFENLIVLSMNEGVFPKSGNVPSFIPYSLRKGLDMPTIEHQDAIFAYYFYRLLQRSQNVVLVYSSSVNDMKSGEASRFIHQLIYEEAFKVQKETLSYTINPISERTVQIDKTPEVVKILTETFAGENARALSPSAINTYLNCKTRFYYRYVAGIKEPDTILEEVEANTLGSILHKTMEELYKPFINILLTNNIIQEIIKNKQLIHNTILHAFWDEYLSPGKPFPENEGLNLQGKNTLIKEVIYKYVLTVLEYDKQQAPFKISSLEKEFYCDFTTKNKLTISTGGIIDRVDEKEGKARIIDYKTGKSKDTFSDIESLFYENATKRNDAAFQTLLYSLVFAKISNNDSIQPNLYFVRNMRKTKYNSTILIGKGQGKSALNGLNEVKTEFERYLMETINDIFSEAGNFNQTDDTKYCEYCPYAGICGK
jgi:CRISPR/Cas system-associated exonuclease Cas4 (RecB family)